jgi:hypothetical protein
LKSGQEIKVVQQDPQTIIIQPANPQIVYVPVYNPTVVYGVPYSPPGYSSADLAAAAIISFGVGMMVGAAMSNNSCCKWGWGYGGWGTSWRGGTVIYQKNVYVSRSTVYRGGYRAGYGGGYYGGPRPTPYNRGNYNTGNINTGNRQTNIGNTNINKGGNTVNINTGGNTNVNRSNVNAAPKNSNVRPTTADRGYGQRPAPSTNSGAFSGYNKGGNVRAESNRGRSSVGGSGGARMQAQPSGGRRR